MSQESDEDFSTGMDAAESRPHLRTMFEDAMSRASARLGGSREVLLGRFKQNLGSQLSIDGGRDQME